MVLSVIKEKIILIFNYLKFHFSFFGHNALTKLGWTSSSQCPWITHEAADESAFLCKITKMPSKCCFLLLENAFSSGKRMKHWLHESKSAFGAAKFRILKINEELEEYLDIYLWIFKITFRTKSINITLSGEKFY